MLPIEAFFQEIDRNWRGSRSQKIQLHVLGSAALMLQTDYARGTTDGDILETPNIVGETKTLLLAIAGRGTPIHKRHGLYLDVVASGIPLLPASPRWLPRTALNASLHTFEVAVLDIVDLVTTKLKRFHANDQSDVKAMIDRGLVSHDELVARFMSAVDVYGDSASGEDLPKYVRNLHRVERDIFGVPESDIELPDWIEEG